MNGFIEVQSKGSSKLFCQGLSCQSAKYVVDVDKGSLTAKEPRKEQETFQKSELESVATKTMLSYYATSLPSTPQERKSKTKKMEHEHNLKLIQQSSAKIVIIGDSLVKGLIRYTHLWDKYFAPLDSLNLGIGGDCTQNVLWRLQPRSKDGESIKTLPDSTAVLVLLVGTNNIDMDSPKEIAHGISSIVHVAFEVKPDIKIVLCGLLPRDFNGDSIRRNKLALVNKKLKNFCSSGNFKGLFYLKPEDDWILSNGDLDRSLYYSDCLHLNERGYEKLSVAITSSISRVNCGRRKKVPIIFCMNMSEIVEVMEIPSLCWSKLNNQKEWAQ